ncbi:MAG: hypothetical protein RJA07_760 [Bacteroidota bacterium]|jgi:hypothetical protein
MIFFKENIRTENLESKLAQLKTKNNFFGKLLFISNSYHINFYGWQFKSIPVRIIINKINDDEHKVIYSIDDFYIRFFIATLLINLLFEILVVVFKGHYHFAKELFDTFKFVHPVMLIVFSVIYFFGMHSRIDNAKKEFHKNILC